MIWVRWGVSVALLALAEGAAACLAPPIDLSPSHGYVECNPSAWTPLHNGVCQHIRPRAVVYPYDAEGVARAVRYAVARNLTLSYRSGGHSYTCTSLREGSLHVNLAYLDTIQFDRGAMRATLGPGNTYDAVLRAIPTSSHSVAHGGCLSVGVGGFCVSGGGHPPVTRLTGLCNETIEQMTVVTANGTILTLHDGAPHADLWRAMRHAGSSFGIATEFVVRVLDEPEPAQFPFLLTMDSDSFVRFWSRAVARVAEDGVDATVTVDGGGPVPRADDAFLVMLSVRRRGVAPAAQFARAYAYLVSLTEWWRWDAALPLSAVDDLSFAYALSGNQWISTFNCLPTSTCDVEGTMRHMLAHFHAFDESDATRPCWMAWSTPTTKADAICFEYNCPDVDVYYRELALLEDWVFDQCPRAYKYYNVPSFHTQDPHRYFPGGIYDELRATKQRWDPHERLNPLTGV